MSHIDSFKHELVGYFGSIPVYHPLEDIYGDFESSPNQLIIGGGSGEHPALVIEDLTAAVGLFLYEMSKEIPELEKYEEVLKAYIYVRPEEVISFYEWNAVTYRDFYEMCDSPAMQNPVGDEFLEMWLIKGIGEFVFHAMPKLAANLLTKLENPHQYFKHIYYNNILLLPPNFPVYSNGGNMFFSKVTNKK